MIAAQSMLMRVTGTRRLNYNLETRLAALDSLLAARMDSFEKGFGDFQHRNNLELVMLHGKLDQLRSELSNQGRYDTERGETIQNTLRGIEHDLKIVVSATLDGAALIGFSEVRTEISELRASLARDVDLSRNQDAINTILDMRTEISDLRREIASYIDRSTI